MPLMQNFLTIFVSCGALSPKNDLNNSSIQTKEALNIKRNTEALSRDYSCLKKQLVLHNTSVCL